MANAHLGYDSLILEWIHSLTVASVFLTRAVVKITHSDQVMLIFFKHVHFCLFCFRPKAFDNDSNKYKNENKYMVHV